MTESLLLDRAANLIFRRLKRAGGRAQDLPEVEQTFVVVYGAQGVIGNGGFEYFFENDWPGRPPYSMFIDAYRRIGATGAARRLERAVGMFPFERPHLAGRLRNRFIQALPEDSKFSSLGRAVCLDDSIWTKLEAYVRSNVGVLWRRPNKRMQLTRSAKARPRGPRS